MPEIGPGAGGRVWAGTRGWRIAALALSCALGLPHAWPAQQPGWLPRARAASPAPPDVVLIVVDTLRADRVRTLGPRLSYLPRLRARGACFSDARSTSSWTPTATASILTGLLPTQHGVRAGHLALDGRRLSPVDRLAEDAPYLPALMRRAGYRTLGVSDNVNIGPTMGFDRGFDDFASMLDAGADVLASRAAEMWTTRREGDRRPSFLYLHPMDPHAPYLERAGYRAPADAGDAALARYDSEILHLDRALGRLHRRVGWNDGTLIVFTSDHGEAFGEHGSHGHPNQLYDELLAVPLCFSAPAWLPAGRYHEPVSTLDVVPTLRGLLGWHPRESDAGADLSDAMRAAREPAPRALYAMRYSELLEPPLRRRSVVADGHKLIEYVPGSRVELFDLRRDPAELSNLAARRPDTVHTLRGLLADAERRAPRYEAVRVPPPATEDRALLQRLRALGYTR